MSLFPFLQLQAVEPEDDASPLDEFERDVMTLDDTIDGEELAALWGDIMQREGHDE